MYTPGQLTKDALVEQLQTELDQLSRVLQSLNPNTIQFTVLNNEPTKPRQGMVAYADGTNWNPGSSGEGLYQYTSAGWSKL